MKSEEGGQTGKATEGQEKAFIRPKVIVHYAYDLDLEESVIIDSSAASCNDSTTKRIVADTVAKNAENAGKNTTRQYIHHNKKGKMVKPVSPLEAIEEASMELSHSETPSIHQNTRYCIIISSILDVIVHGKYPVYFWDAPQKITLTSKFLFSCFFLSIVRGCAHTGHQLTLRERSGTLMFGITPKLYGLDQLV